MKTQLSVCSPGPWCEEVTMSSDFRHIRYITDANGVVIADVRYAKDEGQVTNLANANLLMLANEMAQALLDIYGVLSDHPDAEVGTRKVHFAFERSKGLVNKFLR